jgi:hypothetical protein
MGLGAGHFGSTSASGFVTTSGSGSGFVTTSGQLRALVRDCLTSGANDIKLCFASSLTLQ